MPNRDVSRLTGSCHRRCLVSIAAACSLLLGACRSIGPPTIDRDRLDYSTAITESWKRQTLSNIVKLRYADPPIFVDVAQIVSGYSLETTMSLSAASASGGLMPGQSQSLGGQGRYTDRPTITYVPLTGNSFVAGLMTPIPPNALFLAIQPWPP